MKTKILLMLLSITFLACNDKKEVENVTPTEVQKDTVKLVDVEETTIVKEFSNERFRKVTFEKLSETKFKVQGEAQVFEATINWSVEDGHNVYKDGFTTASMGAPEWGEFDFTFEIKDANKIEVLNLMLFEISMKDGNQTNLLLIPLK